MLSLVLVKSLNEIARELAPHLSQGLAAPWHAAPGKAEHDGERDERAELKRFDGAALRLLPLWRRPERVRVVADFPNGYHPWDHEKRTYVRLERTFARERPMARVAAELRSLLREYDRFHSAAMKSKAADDRAKAAETALAEQTVEALGGWTRTVHGLEAVANVCDGSHLIVKPMYGGSIVRLSGDVPREVFEEMLRLLAAHQQRERERETG